MKKQWFKYIIFYGVCILIGVGLGLYAGFGNPFYGPMLEQLTFMNFILFYLFLLISLFLVINIHEAGHFVTGKLIGMRLLIYRIGFLEWKKVNGKLSVDYVKNNGYSGLCAMSPPEDGVVTKWQYSFFFAGGILFNLFSAVFAYLIMSYSTGNTRFFFGVFTIISGLIVVMNSYPFKASSNMYSDGAYILGLLREKKEIIDKIAVVNFANQIMAGTRPKALDFDGLNDNEDVTLLVLKHYHALDCFDMDILEQTTEALELRLSDCDPLTLTSVQYELVVAGILLMDNERVERIRPLLKRLDKDKDANGHRVKAFLAYYDQNDEKARDHIDEARRVLPYYPSIGQQQMEQTLLNYLESELEEEKANIN